MERLIDQTALASATAARIIITTSTYKGEIKLWCLTKLFVWAPTKTKLIDEND